MKFINVSEINIHLLDDFINQLGTVSKTFRYFNSRTSAIIKNHLTTLLIMENGKPVAYGHFDVEKDVVWLGVCVLPDYQGKGYGKAMMTELLNFAKRLKIKKINLTVDKINKAAIKLYENFNFEREGEFENIYKYSLVSKI